MMNTQLATFNNHNIELIRYNNQDYMALSQIVIALQSEAHYISQQYNRHKSEFNEEMSCLIRKDNTRIRIFNREGAWLIGMFARTPKAAEFRKWVLKVLRAVADNQLYENSIQRPTVTIDMNAIGGVVKKCCAVAVRQELNAILAGDPKADWEVSDQDLIYQLHRWHATKSRADTEEFRRLVSENEELKKKIAAIKKAVR